MTATTVNGIKVLESERIEAPISTSTNPIYFKQARRLLLADETELYGCIHCDFADTRIGVVRTHLKTHRPTKAPAPQAPSKKPTRASAKKTTAPATPDRPAPESLTPASLASLNLGQLVERAQAVTKTTKERDLARKERDAAREELTTWMDRTAKAERSLAAIRAALDA
ncbi:hypothetical protein [Streptomyces sp. NPDC051183]|uniref:hypothetical protein n=1 Tax=Streptomyces sp. NPDC051183 TaxID=3155165 RepID=UPI003443BF9C